MPQENDLIQLFLDDQKRLRRSRSTVTNRQSQLRRFLRDVGSFDITSRRLQAWLAASEYKDSTKRNLLDNLSEFYKWGIRCSFFDEDPTSRIALPPREPPRRSISEEEIQRAIAADAGAVPCWIALAAYQGLQCREMATLTREDLDLSAEPAVVRVRENVTGPRSSTLHPSTVAALEQLPVPTRGPLFQEADPQTISKAISKHLRDNNITGSAATLVDWYRRQVEALGKDFGRSRGANAKFDETSIDPDLWDHISGLVVAGEWGKVASQTAIFTEDRVRTWAHRPETEVGEKLMSSVFGDYGRFRLGANDGERSGWHRLAMGISMALRNVDAHRIQNRGDHQRYAIGVVGVSSLLLTQMRYQHPNQVS